MNLTDFYEAKKATPSSSNEHMDTLRKYAVRCEHVTEFGVSQGYSTVAFLTACPAELHSYDITRQPEIDGIEAWANQTCKTKFVFHQQSSLEADFESTDLLLVDSLHTYDQVRQELALHGHKVRKYLIFHDTIFWAYKNEIDSGGEADHAFYSRRHKQGIGPAIEEYMTAHPEWQIIEHHYHQSGLTVYARLEAL